jgi:CDP-diacylglycerol--glycerol-3-phosphate 3-phosphatidyltransferase
MRPATAASTGEGAFGALKDRLKHGAHAAVDPIVRALIRVGARADHLTWLGFALSMGAAYSFFEGHFRLAATVLIVSGVCDILDGQVARQSGTVSKFGAFLDSTLDRVAEGAVLLGLLGFYLRNLVALVFESTKVLEQYQIGLEPITWAVVGMTAGLALLGSLMVSYTRARAEGLGLECKVGWFERPERMVLLIVAGLLKVFWAMSAALLLLAILSFITAAQRVMHVHRITRGAGMDHLEG